MYGAVERMRSDIHAACEKILAEGYMLAFESLVLSQKPAGAPWTPVTDYSFEARKAIEGIHPQLINDVFSPDRIYDAGCGNGTLSILLRQLGIEVCGFDRHLSSSELNPIAWRQADLASGDFTDWASADLVICREVLEHLTLREIRKAVTNLCALSHRFVYVTTRFSSEHGLLRVETSDDLDPTHITIPSKDLIRLLFVLEGFKRRADLEERMDWKKLNRCLVYERAV